MPGSYHSCYLVFSIVGNIAVEICYVGVKKKCDFKNTGSQTSKNESLKVFCSPIQHAHKGR